MMQMPLHHTQLVSEAAAGCVKVLAYIQESICTQYGRSAVSTCVSPYLQNVSSYATCLLVVFGILGEKPRLATTSHRSACQHKPCEINQTLQTISHQAGSLW